MKVLASLSILVVMTMTASCAGGAPSSPTSPTNPRNPVSVPEILVRCPEFGESSRCTASTLSNDVTGLAAWSTSDPAIATVTSTGLVTAHATGEVAIRASYQGGIGFVFVWAIPGQGLHGTSRTLEGEVVSLTGPLPDVLMAILDGPNSGRRMVTGANGRFFMDGLQDGQFTIRLSKPGYVTAEYVWRIPGGKERFPTLTASR